MILPIYTYGQPALRRESADIEASFTDLAQLLENMFQTLANSEGVGLAAPQIGQNIRVVVIDLDVLKDDLPEYAGFHRAYINAHILGYDNSKLESMEEGCLSLPGISEKVRRPARVHVKYVDADFQPHDEWVDGYLARVMQHEFDHLDGRLFIDRLSPLRKQLIHGQLNNLLRGRFSCRYPVRPVRKR